MSKVLVLHSGGLTPQPLCTLLNRKDTQLLAWALTTDNVYALSSFAEKQCQQRQIERQVIEVRWTKPDRHIPLNRKIEDIRLDPSPAFLPGRNTIFLALASAHGAGIAVDEVWTEINTSIFPAIPTAPQNSSTRFAGFMTSGIRRDQKLRRLFSKCLSLKSRAWPSRWASEKAIPGVAIVQSFRTDWLRLVDVAMPANSMNMLGRTRKRNGENSSHRLHEDEGCASSASGAPLSIAAFPQVIVVRA